MEMEIENPAERAAPRGSARQVACLRELEQQAAELELLSQQVKSAHTAIGLAKLVVNQARLRKQWLELAGRWMLLQCRLDESMRRYEAAYGPLGARNPLMNGRRKRPRAAAADPGPAGPA